MELQIERVGRRQGAAAQRAIACLKDVRKKRQFDTRSALVAAEWVWLIGPVESSRARRVAVQVMLAVLVVIRECVVGHGEGSKAVQAWHAVCLDL